MVDRKGLPMTDTTDDDQQQPEPAGTLPVVERITVALIKEASADLAWLIAETGRSKTDCVNRAIQAYAFLEQERRHGNQVLLVNSDSDTTQIVRFV